MGMHMMPMTTALREQEQPTATSVSMPASLHDKLFSWGPPAGQEATNAMGAPQSPRLIDFIKAEVHAAASGSGYILGVTGEKPYLNMIVHLAPRIYVRQPEYWQIEVVGILPGIGLPAVGPYSVSLPVDGILGTKGVEIAAATKLQRIDVRRARPQVRRWKAIFS